MATHPDDPNVPGAGEHQPEAKPAEGEPSKAKHTRLPRQAGKPTMIQPGGEEEGAPAPVPNMSLEQPEEEIMALEPVADDTEVIPPGALPADAEDIPVLEAAPAGEATEAMAAPSDVAEMLPVEEDVLTTEQPAGEAPKDKSKSHVTAELLTPQPAPHAADDVLFGKGEAAAPSDVVEAEPVSGVAEAEALFEAMEAEPISAVGEAQPASGEVTGADVPGAEVTGADHVLGDDLAEAEPISAAEVLEPASDVLATAEPASGAEAVLGDEPLDRGSRPSARVESPIRAEADDDDAVDLGGPLPPGAKKPAKHEDLDATEEVLAGEPAGRGSSAINWNEIGEDSGGKVKAPVDETVPYDVGSEGSSDDSLLHPEDLAKHADESSAVNLGDVPGKSKSQSGIDVVAEALESGVNLEDEVPLSPTPGTPSVEFDDILTDSSESMPPVKKSPASKQPAEEDFETLAPTDDDLEAVDKRKKKKKRSADDEAAALFAEDDEAEAVAVPAEDDEAEAVAVPAEEDEAEAIAVADEDEAVGAPAADADTDEVAPKKKKGKAAVAEADEEPPAKTRAKTKPEAVPVRGPSCLGRLVTWGFFTVFGMVLLVGALAALVFADPNLVHSYVMQIPGMPQPKKIIQPTVSPVQRAYPLFAQGNYGQVIDDLKDESEPDAVGLRGEATWLKYAKAKGDAKQPLSEKDKEVQDAIKDLKTANHNQRAEEILRVIREPDEQKQLAQAKETFDMLTKARDKAEADRKQADALVKDIGGVLVGAKVIPDADKLSADSVRALVKELNDHQTEVARINKRLQNAKIKDFGAKGVDVLLAAKKDSEDKLTDVNKLLADAKVKDPGAKGVQELLAARAKVQKDRDELDAAAKAAYDELVKANVVPAGGDPRKGLVQGAKLAREKGESPLAQPLTYLGSALAGLGQGVGRIVTKTADTSLLAADLALLRAREPLIQTPAQKLDLYAALLQDRSRQDPKQLATIQRDADWVLTREAKVTPAARAKALYVTGLALRNEGKYDAARKTLDGAIKHAGANGTAWQKQARSVLAELTNPQAYYLPEIERMQAAGNLDSALAQTDVALKVLPGDGKLLAERALLRLESLRAKGKLSAEAQKQIRTDADAAAKSTGGTAEGAYVLGLLEEELGQYGKAEEHLRAALKLHKGSEDEAVRYRVALARVLLQDRPAAAAPAVPPPPADDKDDKKGADAKAPAQQPISVMHPVTALILTATIGAQPEEAEPEHENPATAKRLREAVELARVLAGSKDAKVREQGYALLAEAAGKAGLQLTSTTCIDLAKGLVKEPDPKVRGTGMMLMGQSLVKQGRRTEGLKEYTRGLELVHPDLATREIGRMVEEHPAFQHPDAANKPNPLLAEKYFGNGLHLYWARHYPEAEVQFKQAMDYFNQDARYAYFLGLSQLAQNTKLKRDQAYYSFEQGAKLEAQGRPSIGDINTSLERVQGGVRQLLNAFRFRGVAAAAE